MKKIRDFCRNKGCSWYNDGQCTYKIAWGNTCSGRIIPKQKVTNTNTECTELIDAYEAYIKLLVEEINELASIAIAHNWTSSRFDEGNKARLRIKEAKENLPF